MENEAIQVTSTRTRTLTKSVTYHLLVLAVDVPFYVALNVGYYHLPFYSVLVTITGLSASLELILHTGIMYEYDRLWKRIGWGKIIVTPEEADRCPNSKDGLHVYMTSEPFTGKLLEAKCFYCLKTKKFSKD
jgi:hypothetical protein